MTTGNADDTITKLMAELITPSTTIQGTMLRVDLSLCDKCTEDSDLCALASLANGIVKLPSLDFVLPIAQSTKDGHTTHILKKVNIASPPKPIEPAVIIYCAEPKPRNANSTVCGVGMVTQKALNSETPSSQNSRLTPPILNMVRNIISEHANPGFVYTSVACGPEKQHA